jgi:type I restriction enzyme S subunit
MEKQKNIPHLRFPEFNSEWDKMELIELSVNGFSNGAFNDPKKVGTGYRIINVKDMYVDGTIDVDNLTRVAIDEKEFSKNRVEYGDIFFTRSSLVKEGIAHSNVNLNKADDLTFDGHLIRMRPIKEKYSPIFLYYNFGTPNTRIQFIQRGKTTTMTTIGQDDIAKVEISIPTLPEQTKIASFLTAVDEKLQALKKKKSLLEQYKKGMMQKLFSQELKFKDDNGNDFPDWEEKQVKDIFTVTRGNVLAMSLVEEKSDKEYKYPVYSSQTKNKGLAGYYKDYLFEDAITWTTDGAGAGDVNFRKGKFYCTNVCGVLFSEKGYANLFIAELLNSISRKYVSYVGNPKLMNNVMAEILINIPESIIEQTKIANFLSAIDDKINTVQQQIEKTEVWKKGLLQKMFV